METFAWVYFDGELYPVLVDHGGNWDIAMLADSFPDGIYFFAGVILAPLED